MMKKFAVILTGIQTLFLTLGIALPAQAAINIGTPIDNSGSVVTLHLNPSYNQNSGSSYTIIYPNGSTSQTSGGIPGQTGGSVPVQTTGQTPVPTPTQGSTQPGTTTQTTGTSVVSLNGYYNSNTYTTAPTSGTSTITISGASTEPISGSSSVPIVVPVSGQSTQSSSSVPITLPSSTPSTTTTTTPTSTPSSTSSSSTPSSYPTIAPVTSLTPDQQSLVDMVNQERANAGLAPLKVDFRLVSVAQAKAQDMKTNNYFGHTSPTYGTAWAMMSAVGINYQYAGENIAGNDSVAGAMAAWMSDPGHRANILNPQFTDIGVGIVYGSAYGNLYVQEFAQE